MSRESISPSNEFARDSAINRAREDIAAHKEHHDDPHFALIRIEDLNEEDFSMYADSMEGRLDERMVGKRIQELRPDDPRSVSRENLYAFLKNIMIAKKAEEQLSSDEATLH